MARTHNLGFPRIGAKRQLKFALDRHFRGELDSIHLETVAAQLRDDHFRLQSRLNWTPVGDFSLYDHVLDTSFLLGNVPARVMGAGGDFLSRYFRAARGRAPGDALDAPSVAAGELTKWWNTNYHFIVPEISSSTEFHLHPERLLAQVEQAQCLGVAAKPVLLGPVSYLRVARSVDGTSVYELLPALTQVYRQLLETLAARGIEWVQFDEPILATDLDPEWQRGFEAAYATLRDVGPRLLLASYFGPLGDNVTLLANWGHGGVHLDCTQAQEDLPALVRQLDAETVLSMGVVDGRNVFAADLERTLQLLDPLHERLGDRLWVAPSCSLLHVPVDLESEPSLEPRIAGWLSFAVQKIDEVVTLGRALNHGRDAVRAELEKSAQALRAREQAVATRRPEVRATVRKWRASDRPKRAPHAERARIQAERFALPLFPTTTIGSFPQTQKIRAARRDHRSGTLDSDGYRAFLRQEIALVIAEQEKLGLDVLVHGEAERNDMVEYFGEALDGFLITQFGWVQSYGSRCVKPPILYGDVARPGPITTEWIGYAQSLTERPVKGMLTGPVTILNWSFVRDDQPRSETCLQLALAVRDEVLDLERAGVRIIQIDEAALREGLPLRKGAWTEYLSWATDAFRICSEAVQDATQIHTHMCYSNFNDIIEYIASMDADVITIETSRSHMALLDTFERFRYPNQIGPGVYDIHSPAVPSVEQMIAALRHAARLVPVERLWVNPDCGLKTRTWPEVDLALRNMVEAARVLRKEILLAG